jgi:dTDP-4-amino-4,6-dideoxygalactose transaminase
VIPFVDLAAQHSGIREEIESAIGRVLDSSTFVLGDEVARFEEEFAAYCGARFGIAVNSGTSALHLALLAAGVGPGDEVVTVPLTFVATVAAICYTGATPVFVDVDPESLTLDAARLAAALTPRTKAIIPVHLHGQPAAMDPIRQIARHHGAIVIEDACQAHGAEHHGRRVGSISDFGCFSFYPGKNLGACGEGGIVVTNNDAQAHTIRMLRDWGQQQKYCHTLKGFNYRMDAIQGAILRVKLRHLDQWTARRRARATLYDQLLRDVSVRVPRGAPETRHVYHIYAIRSPGRDTLRDDLAARGIQTGIHYPIPVHLQPAYADLGYAKGDFPAAEQAARELLSLPMFPELTEAQVERVVAALQRSSSRGFCDRTSVPRAASN